MIRIEKLSKRYRDAVALDCIDLTFLRGEITFLCGTSGAGKSTLLYQLGLLERPTEGSVSVDGVNISALTEREAERYRGETISYVFQENNLVTGTTVADNIATALSLAGCDVKEEEIRAVLQKVGIEKLYRRRSETLSGGERQRVCIAIALLKRSQIILADEPTGALDSENATEIFRLLRDLRKDRYVVIVTHDTDLAERFADRIVTLSDGKVVSDRRFAEELAETPPPSRRRGGRFSLRRAWRLGADSLRRKWKSQIFVYLTLILVVAVSSTALNLYDTGTNVVRSTNNALFETDRIEVKYGGGDFLLPPYLDKIQPMSRELLEEAIDTDRYEQITPYYQNLDSGFLNIYASEEDGGSISGGMGFFSVDENVQVVQWNDFFRNRLNMLEIEGEIPASPDEIILSATEAQKLREDPNDMIGQKLLLWCTVPSGEKTEVTVTAINYSRTGSYSEYDQESGSDLIVIPSYFSDELIAEILQKHYDDYRNIIEEWEKNLYTMKVSSQSASLYTRALVRRPSEESYLYGTAPGEGQIAVSAADVRSFYAMAYPDEDLPEDEEIRNGTLDEATLNKLYAAEFAISFNTGVKVKISGIYEWEKTEGSNDPVLLISDDVEESLFTVRPSGFRLYIKENVDIRAEVNTLKEAFPFLAVTSPGANSDGNKLESVDGVITALAAVGVVLCLLAAVLIYTCTKLDISQRKYDIGLMRSWGASAKELFLVFLFDAFMMSVVSLGIGLSVSLAVTFAAPSFIGGLANVVMRVSALGIVAVVCGVLVVSMLSVTYLLLRARKLTPRECIMTR